MSSFVNIICLGFHLTTFMNKTNLWMQDHHLPLPSHSIHVSSSWVQLFSKGLRRQSWRFASCPEHDACLIQMGPLPWVILLQHLWVSSARPHPSCLHTTFAARKFQPALHTVLHCSWCSTSTRPWQRPGPSTSRTSLSGSGKKGLSNVCSMSEHGLLRKWSLVTWAQFLVASTRLLE